MTPQDPKPCPACNGTGKYYDFDQIRDCPMCDEEPEYVDANSGSLSLAKALCGNTEATEPSKPRRQAVCNLCGKTANLTLHEFASWIVDHDCNVKTNEQRALESPLSDPSWL